MNERASEQTIEQSKKDILSVHLHELETFE